VIPVSYRVGRLHVITDTTIQDRFDHEELARLAIAGGADTIQLRDKLLSDEDLTAVARGVLAVCRLTGVPLVVNDRIHVAAASGADGVHLGHADAPVGAARAALGPGAIIGGTAATAEEVVQIAAAGADYAGFGHVYPTSTKQKPGPPVGLDGLGRACAVALIPVVGIGGITAETAAEVVRAGAWGVAVIGAVCAADDPMGAARELAMAVQTAALG
jgi:thiamine-phosphate pyrophosphorylase